MKWTDELTRLLGIHYPIIQAPMFGVTSPEMVAAASNIHCLGSLALGDQGPEKVVEKIRETRQLTHEPFAVNIFVHTIPELDDKLRQDYAKAKAFLEELAKQNKLDVSLPEIEELRFSSYQEQVDAILSENCKILSFTFGNLDKQSIEKLKENGTVLIGTCTSVAEAKILENSGIDVVCVQGWEAGGHRGSFDSEEISKIGGISLLAQVSEAVKVPIIYAGGIYNGKTLLASKSLGASGFQVGSLLLGSSESLLKNFEKDRLGEVDESDIVLTNSFSGRFARGIKNTFITEAEKSGFILPYPYQNKLTYELRKAAKFNENADFVSIWVGQSIPEFDRRSTSEILTRLIQQVEFS